MPEPPPPPLAAAAWPPAPPEPIEMNTSWVSGCLTSSSLSSVAERSICSRVDPGGAEMLNMM